MSETNHGKEDRECSDSHDSPQARDPVCGMLVDPQTAKHRAEHEGQPYFSMDYVEGRTLAELVRSLRELVPCEGCSYGPCQFRRAPYRRGLVEYGVNAKALRRWPHDPDFFVLREAGTDERLPWDFLDQGVTKAHLAREWRRGREGKVTAPCAIETCRACGLDCADRPELRPGA